jgi:hypothetical protein
MFDDKHKDGNSLNIGLKYLFALQATVSGKELSKRGSEDKNSHFSSANIMDH